jgi:hypothetical protein
MAPDDGEIEPDKFFPERGHTAVANEAILACFGCKVRKQCDDYKERTGTEYGIWAGEFTERKKKK